MHSFKNIRNEFIKILEADDDLLLTYHCNVACFFRDNLDLGHIESNAMAAMFLMRVFEPLNYDYKKFIKVDDATSAKKSYDSYYNDFFAKINLSGTGEYKLNGIPLKKVVSCHLESEINSVTTVNIRLYCDKVDFNQDDLNLNDLFQK